MTLSQLIILLIEESRRIFFLLNVKAEGIGIMRPMAENNKKLNLKNQKENTLKMVKRD